MNPYLPQNMANLGLPSQNQLNQGNQVVVTAPARNQGILKANTPECSGPQFATIVLTRDDIDAANYFTTDFFARIKFGIGGFNRVIECDWRDGAVISVPASCVEVEANILPPTGAPSPTGQSRLGAKLAFGSVKASAIAPTRTLPFLDLSGPVPAVPIPAAGVGTIEEIPPFAAGFRLQLNNLSVLGTEAAAANAYPQSLIAQFRNTFEAMLSWGTFDYTPLVNGVTSLTLTNNSAISLGAFCAFELVV